MSCNTSDIPPERHDKIQPNRLMTGTTLSIDYGHSAYWNGVSGVSAAGSPVSGWTLTSASGTSYLGSFAPTVHVPEGGSLAIVPVCGLLALGLWRRNRSA